MSDALIPPPEAPADPDPVTELCTRIGLPVADRVTALAALTHKSYVNEHRDEAGLADNERLEFLGDAVIDLAVSHRLMERFPTAREGELSKMRAAVVDEQGLSEMARALGLGELLRLGRGEELTGGRRKASLLADAMEAVIAAVYLGDGLEPVLRIVDRFLGEAFARAAAGTLDRDFKTQLQELAQSRMRSTPRYRVVAEHGPDHSKTFEVETDVRGEVIGRGTGRSKKDAEQAAAKLALDALGRRFSAATPELAPAAPAPAPAIAREPSPPAPPAPAPAPEAEERAGPTSEPPAAPHAAGAPGHAPAVAAEEAPAPSRKRASGRRKATPAAKGRPAKGGRSTARTKKKGTARAGRARGR
jgi:ribonuclease-3